MLRVPEDWVLLAPADAALDSSCQGRWRSLGCAGKEGAADFQQGVWAPAATVDRIRTDLEAERATDAYAKTSTG